LLLIVGGRLASFLGRGSGRTVGRFPATARGRIGRRAVVVDVHGASCRDTLILPGEMGIEIMWMYWDGGAIHDLHK
jgi:hypothetical protein